MRGDIDLMIGLALAELEAVAKHPPWGVAVRVENDGAGEQIRVWRGALACVFSGWRFVTGWRARRR